MRQEFNRKDALKKINSLQDQFLEKRQSFRRQSVIEELCPETVLPRVREDRHRPQQPAEARARRHLGG